jgi:septation ring formation regulator EzrA
MENDTKTIGRFLHEILCEALKNTNTQKSRKKKYDNLNEAVKKMRMPYYNAAEFIEDQIDKNSSVKKEKQKNNGSFPIFPVS